MPAAPYRDEHLPRYTSYPTAPHFNAGIDAHTYGGWLKQLKAGTTTSLYLHVPFCRSMCWYCGCHTTVALRDGPIVDYLAALRGEIALVAGALSAPLDVRHVHFGGGTPTILEPADFVALVALLRQHFPVHPDAEIAVEIDPRRLGPSMTAALAAAGVNRASLGVQSFDPVVQKAINRIQSVEQTANVTIGLREAGIAAVSFDLIYGLPKQTLQSCRDTVEQCLTMRPDRFSIFGYAHVPQFKKHQRRIAEADLPDGEARHEQAELMARLLTEAGYVRIGLDHFALPEDPMAQALSQGRLHRNFQGYTTDPCEALIERVMCDLSVDIDAVCAQHPVDSGVLAPSLRKLDRLAQEGLVAFDGSRVLLPENARLFVRKVASVFDAHLDQPPRQYSRAV